MSRYVQFGMLALMVFATRSRGADTLEAVIKDGIVCLKQLSETLTTVKGEASAKDARPKLEKLLKKVKELKQRGEALKQPSEE